MDDSRAAALDHLRRTVAMWAIDAAPAADVVLGACQLLVVGFDGPSLCELAAHPIGKADTHIDDYTEAAMAELGLPFHPRHSDAAIRGALAEMADEVLAGRIAPHDLACWAHREFGHDVEAAEELARLDDCYDALKHGFGAARDVDAEVIAEARRIVASRPN